MGNKLVSVIVPVFNNEESLESLVESLLKNPYSNIQLIFGNDASTDSSNEILKKFETNERIKIFNSLVNIGPGAMRNKLITLADGEYIAIQDADDRFSAERFIEQINFLEKNTEIDCVGTGVAFSSNGKIWKTFFPRAVPSTLDWFLQRSMVHASIVFRSKLKKVAKYHEGLRIGEDYYFLTLLYNHGIKFFNIQKEYYIYEIDQEKLKKNSKDKFFKLVNAKIEIAKIFNFPKNVIFLGINLLKLVISYFRSWFYLKFKRKH